MVKADLSGAILLCVYSWWLFFPIIFISWICWLPFRFISKLILGPGEAEPQKSTQIDLKIVESKSNKPLDDILLIHGFPDSAAMWDRQVAALSERYRCLVVTLPYFSGEYQLTKS